ncbi:MAG: hypothetical protein Q6L58_09255 [Thermostichales cyanobacterium BF3_bins_165]
MLSESSEKALSMFAILLVGFFFRHRFRSTEARAGLRALILTIALPASIFLSILNIRRGFDFITPPCFAITINLFYLVLIWILTHFWLFQNNLLQKRSLMMIFPSLAPGLTAFPFIEDFIGRDGLAWAAMSDVGNKIFVLFGLYALAVNWGQQEMSNHLMNVKSISNSKRIHTLIIALLSEPINISILVGFILMLLGFSQADLPKFISNAMTTIAGLTTGLILLFVGISFQFKTEQIISVLSVLLARSGLGFLLSAAVIHSLPAAQQEPLLFVVMPQCGCSLWPFLHMVKVEDDFQKNLNNQEKFKGLMAKADQVKDQLEKIVRCYPKLTDLAQQFEESLRKLHQSDFPKLEKVMQELQVAIAKVDSESYQLINLSDQIKNALAEVKASLRDEGKTSFIFNTDYAMSLLAVSFPFSIGIILFIFADPEPFQNSLDLAFIGMIFLMLHFIFRQASYSQVSIQKNPNPKSSQISPVGSEGVTFPAHTRQSSQSISEIQRQLQAGRRYRYR